MSDPQDQPNPDEPQTDESDSLTLWQVLTSALAAALGVQSSRNRARDFSKGKPGQFIAVGIVLTVLFVITIVTVVNIVLGSAAAGP